MVLFWNISANCVSSSYIEKRAKSLIEQLLLMQLLPSSARPEVASLSLLHCYYFGKCGSVFLAKLIPKHWVFFRAMHRANRWSAIIHTCILRDRTPLKHAAFLFSQFSLEIRFLFFPAQYNLDSIKRYVFV